MAARKRPARAFGVLLAGAMFGSTAYLLVLSITPLLSRRYLPDSAWIGLPNAALILGVAAGTPILTWLFARRGRPFSLGLGLSFAGLAAVGLALSAWWEAGFAVHFGASLLLGCGYAAYHLTRYTAALLVPASKSGRAIGLVVWVAVAGAFIAPVVFGWIERLVGPGEAEAFSLAYVCAAVFYGLGGILFLRSRSLRARPSLGARPLEARTEPADSATSLGRTFGLAIVSLVAAQASMMIVMTMAPLQMMGSGGSLAALGAMMGAHNLGMFALSPVVGMLCDRFGERPIIGLGGATLAAGGLLAAFGPGGGLALGIALYLVGLGWSLAFVAASALISEGPDSPAKVRRQGLADSLNWLGAGVACVVSGVLMTQLGFQAVAFAGTGMGAVSLVAAIGASGHPSPERHARPGGGRTGSGSEGDPAQ
ncbi:MAG: MFS transporter [Acidobacteria bacterium]|nr:MFS transporter [Acidobacteriota bacterium]MYK79677.1 MFS transporter [Acidobacteriota bacterium]